MSKSFKDVCIEYAEEHGCGLPLTAPEFCNALYLWVQGQGKSIADDVIKEVNGVLDGIEVVAGDNITVTADDKQFTVSMSADDLAGLIKSGDEYVVIDKSADGNGVEIHVDKALLDLIDKKVDKPTTASSEVRAICAAPDGSTLYLEPEQFKGAFGIEKGVYFGRATLGIYSPSTDKAEIRLTTNMQINGIFAQPTGQSVVRLKMSTQDDSAGTRRFFTPYVGANPYGSQVIRLWRDSPVPAYDVDGEKIADGLVMFTDIAPYYLCTNLSGRDESRILRLVSFGAGVYMPTNSTGALRDIIPQPIQFILPDPVVLDGSREYYLTVSWSAS